MPGRVSCAGKRPARRSRLVLQGCCESGRPREASLHPGDAIDGVRGDRLKMRAIVESDILRIPCQNIRRLLERWPEVLKPGVALSFKTSRLGRWERAGQGSLLDAPVGGNSLR